MCSKTSDYLKRSFSCIIITIIIIILTVVIGCLGGGMKRLKDDVKELFKNEKDLQWICREMQKTVMGKRDNYEKNTIWTIDMRCL